MNDYFLIQWQKWASIVKHNKQHEKYLGLYNDNNHYS